MKHCDHISKCEHCHEEMQKLKVEASIRSGLVGELRDKLGVAHLKGRPQLDAALRRVEQLLLIEEIAAAAERDFVSAANERELEGA